MAASDRDEDLKFLSACSIERRSAPRDDHAVIPILLIPALADHGREPSAGKTVVRPANGIMVPNLPVQTRTYRDEPGVEDDRAKPRSP
jgi:hypothetical protein